MSGLSQEDVMRLIMRYVPEAARRAASPTTIRFGTVDDDQDAGSPYASVLIDGDSASMSVINASGQVLAAGQRVVVDFYPPHGVIIRGIIEPDHETWARPWGAAWGWCGGALGNDVSFAALTPVMLQVEPIGGSADAGVLRAGRSYKIDFHSLWRSTAADTTLSALIEARISGGTYGTLRTLRDTAAIAAAVNATETLAAGIGFRVAADGRYDFRVTGSRLAGTGTINITGTNTRLDLYDMGPYEDGNEPLLLVT